MIYRYLFHFFFALIAPFPEGANAPATDPATQEYIVTKFAELPNFYEELRPQSKRRKSKVNEWAKVWICEKNFGLAKTIDPGKEEYRAKLQQYSPAIFDELFQEDEPKEGIVSKVKALIGNKSEYVYNLSKVRTFLVAENERTEKTFACVLRNSDETQFEMHFVSHFDYDLNEAPNREGLIGRFLFFENRMYALAEDPPITQERIRKSYFYQKKSGAYKMGTLIFASGTLLDRGRRFRLCRYVCYLIQDDCEDRIAFQEQCTQKEYLAGNNNESYEEWMLVCEIMVNPSLKVEYPVARAYMDNNVHVFKRDNEGRLRMIYDVEKVGFVVDEADRT